MTFGMTGSITGTRTSVLGKKTEESNHCGIEPMWSKIYVERNYRGKKLMRNVINEEKN